jgi:aspartate/tyrosine/aromatic aminotransferase
MKEGKDLNQEIIKSQKKNKINLSWGFIYNDKSITPRTTPSKTTQT